MPTNKEFLDIYNAITEAQKGATRQLGDVLINSLPIDLEIELYKTIKKLKPHYTALIESKEKIAASYGLKKNSNGTWSIPKEVENKENVYADFFDEMENADALEAPGLNDILPIPLFTLKRLKESGIEFANCPNKQLFFEHCVIPD